MQRIVVTGGAGFVGANLAIALKQRFAGSEVVAFDNLSRRGSELNLQRLFDTDIEFRHGDVRVPDDLAQLEPLDALVECSAEPSVLAGLDGSPSYVVQTNLMGAYNCLELVRRNSAQLVFLSTSRVYPVERLRAIALEAAETRFEIAEEQTLVGVSPAGVSEDFPMRGARTMYGATKLAAEHLIEEYQSAYGLSAVVNRCGVIAGPWQMGRVDQGVFTYWMLSHVLRRPLRYIGFGGSGKQVRDLLHVDDLVDLVSMQLGNPDSWAGRVVNVGGGHEVSLSLRETTSLCAEISGIRIDVQKQPEERPGDVPVFVSDCRQLFGTTEWRPRRDARTILADTFEWIRGNERAVRAVL